MKGRAFPPPCTHETRTIEMPRIPVFSHQLLRASPQRGASFGSFLFPPPTTCHSCEKSIHANRPLNPCRQKGMYAHIDFTHPPAFPFPSRLVVFKNRIYSCHTPLCERRERHRVGHQPRHAPVVYENAMLLLHAIGETGSGTGLRWKADHQQYPQYPQYGEASYSRARTPSTAAHPGAF